MAPFETDFYRIVNVGRGTVITVLAENNGTIAGWRTLNRLDQEWLVRRSGEGYHISDRVRGRYITADSAVTLSKARLESDPTLWEIVPVRENTWRIKLMGHDLVLDLYGGDNGSQINLRPITVTYDTSYWRLEGLGDSPNDESRPAQLETTEKDRIIGQMAERLAEKDKQLVELASQLTSQNQGISEQNQRIADQNQRIADQNQRIADQGQRIADQDQKITDQEREIFVRGRQLDDKDQQLAQANKEIGYLLARAAQTGAPPHQGWVTGVNSSGVAGSVQGEVTSLQGEVERLKGLVNQLLDQVNKMPNNMR